jgi:endonuclease/exonuclease/phosphatase family metal-dependent hydrolase
MVTYNVLFDKYDAAKICTAERIPQIFSLLSECHADVICLQEVTGAWLRLLLKQQFVRKSFWASDGPECLTLQEYGQVILSRLPFRASVMQFSRMKMCVVAELQFGAHSLGVAAVHLSSNYFDGGADGTSGVTAGPFQEKREKQLGVVVERLQRSELCVIAGDFNYDPKRDACPDPADFSDADDTDSITFDAVKVNDRLCLAFSCFFFFVEESDCCGDFQVWEAATLRPRAVPRTRHAQVQQKSKISFFLLLLQLFCLLLFSVECSLLGTAAVVQTSSGRLLCPSDHFGVVARLALPCAVQRFAGVEQLLLAQKSHLGTAEVTEDKQNKGGVVF